jgi:hypothetical protein
MQKGEIGEWEGGMGPKQNQNPAGQALNPVAPWPVSRTHRSAK